MPLIPIFIFGGEPTTTPPASFVELVDDLDPLGDEAPHFVSIFAPKLFRAEATSTQEITKLDVFNVAALALGVGGIEDPDENSAVAELFRNRWDMTRKSFLEEHTWNGAKRTVSLIEKTTSPVDRWTNQFTLPPDTLRVITINGVSQSDGTDAFEVEVDMTSGERVVMTDASTVKAVIVVDVVNLSHLKTKVLEAMGLYLAYQCAAVYPMSGGKLDMLREKMGHAISMAKGTDGQEGTPPQRAQSWLVRDRKSRH